MLANHKIGVIVLAYKVENQITETVESIPHFVDQIYIIDDGSPDKTVEHVKSFKHKTVKLIQHGYNRGPGAALSTGYRTALDDDMDIVVKNGDILPT